MLYRYPLEICASLSAGDSVTFFLPRFPQSYGRTIQEIIANKAAGTKTVQFTDGDSLTLKPLSAGKMMAEYHSANRAFSSEVQRFKRHAALAVAS